MEYVDIQEINYTTHEKELLAIIREIKKFSLFLLSKKLIVETDNSQVAGLIKNKLSPEPKYRRFHRWKAYLTFYNFDIINIKGVNNYLSDFLSRNIEFANG